MSYLLNIMRYGKAKNIHRVNTVLCGEYEVTYTPYQ